MENQEQKIEEPTKKQKPKWIVPVIVIAGIIVLGVGAWAGYNYWLKSKFEPPLFPEWKTIDDLSWFRACEKNSDCVETQKACCGCENGGEQVGINKEFLETWQELFQADCQDIGCITVYNCKEGKVVCKNNKCEFEVSPTADWKTYGNEEYGFEFKYPEDWEINQKVGRYSPSEGELNFLEIEPKIKRVQGKDPEGNNIVKPGIVIYESKVSYEIEKNDLKHSIAGDFQEVIIDGVNGVKKYGEITEHLSPFGNVNIIIILNTQKAPLIFRAFSYDEEIFNQILSTFKFIETYTIQWEKEPVELDYTELDWPKEWTKELEDGSICGISVLDETPNPVMIPYRVGKFISGKYAGGEIITLFTAEAMMGGQWAFLDRFVKLNNNYINLANDSSSLSFVPDCMGEFLKEFWNYKVDKETIINELIPLEILNGAEPNQKIYYKEDSDRNDFVFCKDPWSDKYACENKMAFKDVSSGITVYFGTGAKGEDFSIRMPDGFEKTYTFKYEEVEEINSKITLNTGEAIREEYTAYWISCSTPILNLTNLQKTDLVEIGKNASGSFIYIDKDNKQTKLLYDEIMIRADNYRPFTKTYDEFEKELPLFFWTDPFGRTVKFIRNDYYRKFLAPDGCS